MVDSTYTSCGQYHSLSTYGSPSSKNEQNRDQQQSIKLTKSIDAVRSLWLKLTS
jgi:hypothetical protein